MMQIPYHDIQHFKGKYSEFSCKPGKQVAGIYINVDELVKEESVTKNSRKLSSINKKYSNLQAHHSTKLSFHAFNIFTF